MFSGHTSDEEPAVGQFIQTVATSLHEMATVLGVTSPCLLIFVSLLSVCVRVCGARAGLCERIIFNSEYPNELDARVRGKAGAEASTRAAHCLGLGSVAAASRPLIGL